MRKSYRGDREVQPLTPGHEKGVFLSHLPRGWRRRLGASGATHGATGFRDHSVGRRETTGEENVGKDVS